jgi:hypothetical protein
MATKLELREATGRYRARLRKAGLRPVQIWVPDTRSPTFAKECRRQSLLLKGDQAEREALAFIEAAAERGEP